MYRATLRITVEPGVRSHDDDVRANAVPQFSQCRAHRLHTRVETIATVVLRRFPFGYQWRGHADHGHLDAGDHLNEVSRKRTLRPPALHANVRRDPGKMRLRACLG